MKCNVTLYFVTFRYWNPEIEGQKQLGKEPRLWLVLLKYFNWNYILYGVLHLFEVRKLKHLHTYICTLKLDIIIVIYSHLRSQRFFSYNISAVRCATTPIGM